MVEFEGGDGEVMVPCEIIGDLDTAGGCTALDLEPGGMEIEVGRLWDGFAGVDDGTAKASSASFSVTRCVMSLGVVEADGSGCSKSNLPPESWSRAN